MSADEIYTIVKKYIDQMDHWNLLASGAPKDEFDMYVDNFGAVWSNDDFEHRERHMSLHIRNICRDICNAAEKYYNENKSEFGFIKYKIAQINPNAEQPWEYKTDISFSGDKE